MAGIAAGLAVCGCAGTVRSPGEERGRGGRPAALSAAEEVADTRWLNRLSFGADSASADRLRTLGRQRFLEEQLNWPLGDPPALAAAIAALTGSQQTAEERVRLLRAEQQRIGALTDAEEQQQARNALNRAGNEAAVDTARRHLLRAVHSPAQLREQMTWFWLNHFSVYAGKGAVRWTVGDYEEKAVRPHVFGKFRDLVLATLTSAAMLEYLDNAQSAANRLNENYARELMELHTLGVADGATGSRYTQQDVQELARILTGAGIRAADRPPALSAQRQALYRRAGLFEFNPNRHDFGAKVLLGQRIEPSGFAEVEQAVALLCRQPATARHVARKLALYFVGEGAPAALVDRLVATYQQTDGDIAAMLRTLLLSQELQASLARDGAGKFKDPMVFVVSSLRLAYDGQFLANMRPAVGWLNQLGEPLYGRLTPDGYPITEAAWTSSGQMVRRFEIARAIGSGPAGLFDADGGAPGSRRAFH